MKKITLTSVFLFAAFIFSCAQVPSYAWAKSAGASNYERANSIYVDLAGNSYITGSFHDTIRFGTITLLGNSFVPANYTDMFVAKYDSNGNVVWAKMASAIVDDAGFAICADNSGNVYVSGYFNKNSSNPTSMTFGSLPPINSIGWDDIFLAKYNASGNEQWAKAIGGGANDYGYDLVADNVGGIYLTGSFEGSVNFGTSTLSSAGWGDTYVAKFDANTGANLWAVKAGGSGNDVSYGIDMDGTGSLYITGSIRNSVTFGSVGTLTSSGLDDVFVAKLDASGNYIWAKKGGSSLTDAGRAVVIDGAGNVFIAGYIDGNATFATTSVNTNGAYDVFVAKYDATGNLGWATGDGGPGNDKAFGICRDNQGGLYVTGSFEQNATFGTTGLSVQGISDVFTAKYDPTSGNCNWAMPGGAEDEDAALGIGIDSNDKLYITGYFRVQAFFGTQLVATVYDEVFLVKIDNTLSVGDIGANTNFVNAYPNPTSSTVNVNIDAIFFTNKSFYEIADITGRIISSEKLKQQNSKIDFSLLPQGVYTLKIITENGTAVKQIIKQ